MTNHREGKCLKHEKGKESLNVSNWEKDLSQLKTIHDLERIGHTEEKLQVKAFIQAVEKEAYQRGTQDERQFILNILDGIDIANKEMGHPPDTKAIRFALKSRLI